MNNIREYNAHFTFSEIDDAQRACIAKIFADSNFEIDLSPGSLEFESAGRDTDRLVLKVFKKVAMLLRDAQGELRCEIEDEQDDPHFEFFTIKQGDLHLQRGRLVREPETIVV